MVRKHHLLLALSFSGCVPSKQQDVSVERVKDSEKQKSAKFKLLYETIKLKIKLVDSIFIYISCSAVEYYFSCLQGSLQIYRTKQVKIMYVYLITSYNIILA